MRPRWKSDDAFGRMARVEAERRGVGQARQVIGIGDCGNWIGPLIEREFPGIPRIADWAHAEEHLHECGRAMCGANEVAAAGVVEDMGGSSLWNGNIETVDRVELEGPLEKTGSPAQERRAAASLTRAGTEHRLF